MKRILAKGLTVGMIVAIMTSGMSYAGEVKERTGQPAGGFGMRTEFNKGDMKDFRSLSSEEMLENLEAKLDNDGLSEEAIERIEEQIESIEEKIEFDADIEDLLEDLDDDEKVQALEDYLDDEDLTEGQENKIKNLIFKYTIGEDVLEEIRENLEDVERGERAATLEDMIDSGDYDGDALNHLKDMLEKTEEAEAFRVEMEDLRTELEGLSKEERTERIQEFIDAGDYDGKMAERLENMLNHTEKMGTRGGAGKFGGAGSRTEK